MNRVVMSLDEPVRLNRFVRSCTRFWLLLQRPFLLRRVRRHVVETVDGVPLLVLPDVFNPVVFRSGTFLARTLAASARVAKPWSSSGPRALDMGTGSGVGAIFAARQGYRVVGVDVNPEAVRCARINVLLNRLEGQVEIRQGDLFAPVPGERFDLVLFNPPFFRGEPTDLLDHAWRSNDVMERFAAGLSAALVPQGRALIVLSTDGDAAGMLGALREHALTIETARQRNFGNEVMTIYEVRLPQPGRSGMRTA